MNAQNIKNQIDEALKEFGTYQMEDKGPDEVMDTSKIARALRGNEPKLTADILVEVSKHGEYGDRVVNSILHAMESETLKSVELNEKFNTLLELLETQGVSFD